jgi:regulator of nonsense transcripts 2
VLAKDLLPMDIEFMYLDSMEALRPKMEMFKTLEEALQSLDAQYASVATGGLLHKQSKV